MTRAGDKRPMRSSRDWISLIVAAFIIVGFLLRLQRASGTYLNADEALHVMIAWRPFAEIFDRAILEAHPPLIFYLLWVWKHVTLSEVGLRMIPVLAGTATLWFFYRWLDLLFVRTAALAGVSILAFSPMLVSLSSALRGYTLAHLGCAVALYYFERALRESSARWMAVSGVGLLAAIFANFSASAFALAFGVYGLWHLWRRSFPQPLTKAWIAIQAAGVASYLLFTARGLMKLNVADVSTTWLRTSFSQHDRSPLSFLAVATRDIFHNQYASEWVGWVALGLFLASIVLLLKNRAAIEAALLLLPFATLALFAFLHLLPYGGSRHCSILLLFSAAGVAYTVSRLAGDRPVLVMAVLGVALPLWLGFHNRGIYEHPASFEQKSLMDAAINHVRSANPAEVTLFADQASYESLVFYLAGGNAWRKFRVPGFGEATAGGYRIISLRRWFWLPDDFLNDYNRLRSAYPDLGRVLVVCIGPSAAMPFRLQWVGTPDKFTGATSFGPNITIFEAR